MDLVRTRALRLYEPVSAFFVDWRGADRDAVTVRDLLEHAAGLSARLLDPPPGGFQDAAALVGSLDLVVSCDSAVGHLAGALGAPVWLALSAGSDWRWLRDRPDTPWYPHHRLFRQERPGDWGGVFERMAVALQRVVARSQERGGAIRVRTSPGELLDRVTILEIKSERLEDPSGRRAVAALTIVLATTSGPLESLGLSTLPIAFAALTALAAYAPSLLRSTSELRAISFHSVTIPAGCTMTT